MINSFCDVGRTRIVRVASVAVLVGLSSPLGAHHSFAPYEQNVQITFTGTVTSFEWTNPHVYIEIDAIDENGETRHWLIECANPGILNRVGWNWNMIKAGDVVSVIVSPLMNGEPGALLKRVRLADGTEHGNGGPAGPARIDFDGNPLAADGN